MTTRPKRKAPVGLTLNKSEKPSNEEKIKDLMRILERQPIEASDIQINEQLGMGQYGVVYKVVHKSTDMPMAMKQIEFAFDDVRLKQLKMELDVLHRSNSPYIVKFYGSFLKDTVVCYCMEYMDCGSLDKVYKGGVPEPILAKIAIAMIKGLKYMKDDLSVIHRDVKPTNVLINHDGDIKLCDFGVSGMLVQSVANTYTGCSYYMAPERIDTTNAANQYDVRSDVWSLGVSLVEIGNGMPPFDSGPGVFALLDRIVSGPPPMLNQSKFSPLAQSFIRKCLERDYKVRATYDQLLEDPWIAKYLHEEVDVIGWVRSVVPPRN